MNRAPGGGRRGDAGPPPARAIDPAEAVARRVGAGAGRQRSVVVVAPHFPPSNLTAGHRSRLLAMHLHKFGWRARILSVDPRYYEEPLDPELALLIPEALEVVRTRALPTRPLRLVGDLGIRALWPQYRALGRMIEGGDVDLVYIPIPPNFTALLGPLVERRYGVPFAIDYIDPWVHPWPGSEVRFSKAWWAFSLGRWLEPRVLRRVRLVTAVAPGYYEGALRRSPWLDARRCVAMPYGAEAADFEHLARRPRAPSLFDPADGCRHVVYAGAMLPRAYGTLEAVLTAVRYLAERDPGGAARLRVHFVGTGSSPSDPDGHLIRPHAERLGVAPMVREHPARIPYLDALNHLTHASAVLVFGSDEPHYTASKVFQAVLARRPVIGVLHARSTAAEILGRANAGPLVTFDESRPASTRVEEIARAFDTALAVGGYAPEQVDWDAFRAYTAEAMAARLASAFDRAVEAGP